MNSTGPDIDPRILYLVVVPDWRPEDATPLQGFAFSLCDNSWLIRALCRLPSTIADLSNRGRRQIVQRRMTGGRPLLWHGQSPRAILSSNYPANVPFVVVILGDDQDPAPYMKWSKSIDASPTIVAKRGGHLPYNQLTVRGLAKRFRAVCDMLPSSIDRSSARTAKRLIGEWRPLDKRTVGFTVGGHNSIAPNVEVLESAGYRGIVKGRMKDITSGDEPYVRQIVQTAQSVFDERERHGVRKLSRFFKPTFDLNLFAPAVYPTSLSMKMREAIDDQEQRRFGTALRMLEEQKGYGITSRTSAQHFASLGFKEGEPAENMRGPHPILQIRQMELFLATECMTVFAVSEFSAVLRLTNDVNRTSGIIRNFAQQYRSKDRDLLKRTKSFQAVQARLAEAVPADFLPLIRRARSGVRVVADAHLEWLDVDGLPLCVRKDTTRVPVTPGNGFIGTLTAQGETLLFPEQLNRVLVLSAFKDDDPLKKIMPFTVKHYERYWKDRLSVQFVEVGSEEDLVRALNDYDGSIVIFDGHGGHEKEQAGKLILKDTPVDVWALRGKVERVPPIVLLSACDTHAADRNHGTVANGFLALGAVTVLASVFPLHGIDAAIFIGRLFLRITNFLPGELGRRRRAITWAELVSGMLRMQLATDYLRRLHRLGYISEEQYLEVHVDANTWINLPVSDPFERIDARLIALGLSEPELAMQRNIAVANSSVISYLQVGRPELLQIIPSSVLEPLSDLS